VLKFSPGFNSIRFSFSNSSVQNLGDDRFSFFLLLSYKIRPSPATLLLISQSHYFLKFKLKNEPHFFYFMSVHKQCSQPFNPVDLLHPVRSLIGFKNIIY